jgi:hypothetical protein
MTLGNAREQGVRGLAAFCLNQACRHHTIISADDYPDDIPVLFLWLHAHSAGHHLFHRQRASRRGAIGPIAQADRMIGSR